MMKNYTTILFLILGYLAVAQQDYQANGNSGFGGFFGNSSLNVTNDGTTISFSLTSQNTGFNDGFVFYFDTGAAGRNVIDTDVEDTGDSGRRAISNADDQGNGSIVTFPTGFEASYAVHVDSDFAGIFQIPSTGTVGMNELVFVNSANLDYNDGTVVNFTINFSDLGLEATDSFDFLGVYGNSGNAFTSNEGYGLSSAIADNIGGDDFSFENAFTYASTASVADDLKTNLKVFYNSNGLNFRGYQGTASIQVYNTLGQRVFDLRSKELMNSTIIPARLSGGNMYIVKVSTPTSTVTRKIVVK
ncbi:Por secretion system C-terminal sorting domain-containing protein [Nonlabens sp. Hel1_33_55]|uniref:T9SS type A sorting domain-containing protein n=1 Tax=Nonlabens sp. Hel1_33_55 TaxID=1336802 RepID=UPI000875D108|nr:T9SS type A sorting domain-containing protein [Nonlabens sp. Hel1_33_55]SCX90614.1 Por secretion system C-terminal sorting domain-containing protein [Nonlabens sp. Hel1_33_55]